MNPARSIPLLTLVFVGVACAAQAPDADTGAGGKAEAVLESVPLKHAQAGRAAETLKRVFQERAQANGLPADQVSIIGSQDGNLLMISGDAESTA